MIQFMFTNVVELRYVRVRIFRHLAKWQFSLLSETVKTILLQNSNRSVN